MIDSRVLEKLNAIDERSWCLIYKKIVYYAQLKLNKAGFEIRTEKDSVDADHFATVAIEKLFDGTRAWDFDRFPDLVIHLTGIIKSLISSHFKSSVRSTVKAGGKDKDGSSEDDNTIIDTTAKTKLNHFNKDLVNESPEEIMISVENWKEIERKFDQNKDDFAIFSEWLDGTPPRIISESLEIPINVINNAIKKGKRIAKTVLNK